MTLWPVLSSAGGRLWLLFPWECKLDQANHRPGSPFLSKGTRLCHTGLVRDVDWLRWCLSLQSWAAVKEFSFWPSALALLATTAFYYARRGQKEMDATCDQYPHHPSFWAVNLCFQMHFSWRDSTDRKIIFHLAHKWSQGIIEILYLEKHWTVR